MSYPLKQSNHPSSTLPENHLILKMKEISYKLIVGIIMLWWELNKTYPWPGYPQSTSSQHIHSFKVFQFRITSRHRRSVSVALCLCQANGLLVRKTRMIALRSWKEGKDRPISYHINTTLQSAVLIFLKTWCFSYHCYEIKKTNLKIHSFSKIVLLVLTKNNLWFDQNL